MKLLPAICGAFTFCGRRQGPPALEPLVCPRCTPEEHAVSQVTWYYVTDGSDDEVIKQLCTITTPMVDRKVFLAVDSYIRKLYEAKLVPRALENRAFSAKLYHRSPRARKLVEYEIAAVASEVTQLCSPKYL